MRSKEERVAAVKQRVIQLEVRETAAPEPHRSASLGDGLSDNNRGGRFCHAQYHRAACSGRLRRLRDSGEHLRRQRSHRVCRHRPAGVCPWSTDDRSVF